MRARKAFFLILLYFISFCLYAEEEKKHYVIPAVEMLAESSLLLCFNRFVTPWKNYGHVTWEDIDHNLHSAWVWDQDEYNINQICHPYQGASYFTTARSAGLNFWESAAYATAFGNIPWEVFCECETPAINDFIITAVGGASLGEMLHRFYADSWHTNFRWMSYILAPFEAINYHIFKWEPGVMEDRTEELDTYFFAGAFIKSSRFDRMQDDLTDFYHFMFGAGVNAVYGKPYGHSTKAPFDSFEFHLQGSFSPENYMYILFTDGYLWSKKVNTGLNSASTVGISLHYNFIYSDEINYSDNSLGFTMKSRFFLPNNVLFDFKIHLNWLMLGGTEYYKFMNGDIPSPASGDERRTYDLCTGENIKLAMKLSHEGFGILSFFGMFSGMHTINDAIPEDGSDGFTSVVMMGLSYEHRVLRNLSAGISYQSYYKKGFYQDADDHFDTNHFVSIFCKLKVR
ncbi:MAG: DUF3943 domain-containing protein [Spirochaetia bacterium]|nr:DUF3943 domain-containing protein [Spirochaetia bacterium]